MNPISEYQSAFSKYLNLYVQSLNTRKPKELYEPIQYILQSDAKHIRPVLCLIATHLYQKNYKLSLNAALSIELFHTFSLIHDDILDNSPLRRGKKTIHTKWNINRAILSGDVLLVEAFQLLSKYPSNVSHSLLKVFSKASVEICEGQQEDMNFENLNSVPSAQYIEMIRKKTAVLIGTSLQMGAIVANVNSTEQKKLYKIGENIGIAFQIMDDYLDTFGDTKTFGKKIGNDILTNKKTFLLTKSLELANQKQLSQIKKILKMPATTEKIEAMKNVFQELHIDELTLNTVKDIHQRNLKQIKSLKVNNDKALNTLLQLCEFLINRNK